MPQTQTVEKSDWLNLTIERFGREWIVKCPMQSCSYLAGVVDPCKGLIVQAKHGIRKHKVIFTFDTLREILALENVTPFPKN